MKLSEILKKLGVTVDDDVELDSAIKTTQQQAAGNDNVAVLVSLINTLITQKDNQQNSSQGNADVEKLAEALKPLLKPEVTSAPYAEGFYDKAAGSFDLSKINDQTLKDALSDYSSKLAAKETQRVIDAAYEAELAKRTLAVDKELFKKVIDLSGVTVKEGKVEGLAEAFDALNDKGVYKAQPANPLTSGFKPIDNGSSSNLGNLTGGAGLYQAAAMDAEARN